MNSLYVVTLILVTLGLVECFGPGKFYRRASRYISSSLVSSDAQVEKSTSSSPSYSHYLWEVVKHEAKTIAAEDIRSSTLMTNMILVPNSLEEAIIDCITVQMECPLFTATQLRNIFVETLNNNRSISDAWSLDLLASAINDPSMPTTASALLFSKGYHALAAHRIASSLWYSGRDSLARYFQSLISRSFDSDIHPACQIGPGCYVSSGSGVVLGETGSIGRDCSFSHGVTLGGTGKESGDRHPKVGNGVFFGTGATVLGNIYIGDGSVINAGSVVTKPVAPHTRVGGVPAKFISHIDSIVCQGATGERIAENAFVDDAKLCLDADMNFKEFCDTYLFNIANLRKAARSLPHQA